MERYKEIDHTGDVGIQIFGNNRAKVYENAAFAYFDIICDNLDEVQLLEERSLVVKGNTPALRLRETLTQMILFTQVEDYLFREFEVIREGDEELEMVCRGEKIDFDRHEITLEVKAITYHLLDLSQREDGRWVGQVIFDI